MKLLLRIRQWYSARLEETRYIRHLASPHVGLLKWGAIGLLGVNVLLVLNPLVLKEVIDSMSQDPPDGRAPFYSCVFLVVALCQAGFRYMWRIGLSTGAALVEREARAEYAEKLFFIPLTSLSKFQSGQLITRANSDVDAVRRTVEGGIIVLFDAVIFLLFSPIVMFFLSPFLTLIALLPIPLIPLVVRFYENPIRSRYRVAQSTFGDLTDLGRDVITSLRTVRGYGKEGHFEGRFEEVGKQYVDASLRLSQLESTMIPVLDGVVLLSVIGVLCFGGPMVMNNTITVGTFIAFQQYVVSIRWPAQAVGIAAGILQRGIAASKRIEEILDLEDEKTREEGDVEVESIKNGLSVSLKNLSFSYEGSTQPLLRNITFEIQPGERIAIVGPVGSGKSTLLALLSSMRPVAPGCIYFDDQDLNSIPLATRRRIIKKVSQNPYLLNTTVRDNLEVGSDDESVAEDRLIHALNLASIDAEIAEMQRGLGSLIGERGVMLSGGQRQRLTIARALISSGSRLVLFDDVLSSVDVDTEHRILSHVENLRGQLTEIYVTHRLSTARSADRILVLEDGQITGIGTHQELVERSSWYQGFVKSQLLVEEIATYAASERI
jgi:ATP-binding cassette subfamily B multidrug efflux pump